MFVDNVRAMCSIASCLHFLHLGTRFKYFTIADEIVEVMRNHLSSSSSTPKINILVYNDEGCLPKSVNKIVHTLRELIGNHYAVQKVAIYYTSYNDIHE
jgi:hypothetical protein